MNIDSDGFEDENGDEENVSLNSPNVVLAEAGNEEGEKERAKNEKVAPTILLQGCIEQFLQPEMLVGDDGWKCPTCEAARHKGLVHLEGAFAHHSSEAVSLRRVKWPSIEAKWACKYPELLRGDELGSLFTWLSHA